MFSIGYRQILIMYALLLFPIIFFIVFLNWKKRLKTKLGKQDIINQLILNYSPFLIGLKFLLPLISLILMLYVLSGPQITSKDNKKDKAIDIMIAIDVSNSMLCADLKPSRLESSKRFVNDLIDQIGYNKIGLVCFAGRAFLQMPLTTDLTESKMLVNSISTDAVPIPGTSIGDALRVCDSALKINEISPKTVILITDGEDHDTSSTAAAIELKSHGITVFTIGTGTVKGGNILEKDTVLRKDETGNTVITKLNEPVLKKIASNTGGQYFLLDNTQFPIKEVVKNINKLAKKNNEYVDKSKATVPFPWLFASIALFLLTSEIFMPEIKNFYTKPI